MRRIDERGAKPQRRSRRASAYDRLVWLVDFAYCSGLIATLSGEELDGWRSRVWSFPLRTMTHRNSDDLSARLIAELANEIGHGIRALMRGEPWLPRIGPLTLYLDLKDGKPHARHIANPKDGFLLEAHELIAAEGRRLRRCRRAKCRKVFVANKRQVFCGAQCSQQERTERFVNKHSSRELNERRHHRYVELVRRTRGPAVAKKVRRRGSMNSPPAPDRNGHSPDNGRPVRFFPARRSKSSPPRYYPMRTLYRSCSALGRFQSPLCFMPPPVAKCEIDRCSRLPPKHPQLQLLGRIADGRQPGAPTLETLQKPIPLTGANAFFGLSNFPFLA